MVVATAAVAIPVFVNLMEFGKPTRLTPADLVPIVQSECVPVVRAIKRYQQDTGHLPDPIDDLVPKYIASISGVQDLRGAKFTDWVRPERLEHCVTYDFNPATEGWTVKGPFANGPIPLPKVTLAPEANDASSQP